ncbi:membrane protein [Carbonactinospora thermoautotrophica]|uniref:Membrane protein n=1 Tax=Carbonactinospora thermoautotrophica TaxID=1469144 RepID=A0A132MJR1_9ACTN|nr:membrane protein [Carbonactinospora thermoautotrophica]KWX08301.1 membrane protein [Carbonactinospora thermoautotrophica]
MLEIFYTALLAVAFIAVVWFSGLVVYKLFKGQS